MKIFHFALKDCRQQTRFYQNDVAPSLQHWQKYDKEH
jgi:hypothetical protein